MSEEKNKKRIISRRELLASMGAAGVHAIASKRMILSAILYPLHP